MVTQRTKIYYAFVDSVEIKEYHLEDEFLLQTFAAFSHFATIMSVEKYHGLPCVCKNG